MASCYCHSISLSLSPTPSPLSKKQKKKERKENPRMKREKWGECRVLAGYHLILKKKKSLPSNQFGGKFLQPTTWRLIKPSMLCFSHMIYLLSHVTCLSNTSGWLHESPRNGLEEAFGGKIYPIFIEFFSTGLTCISVRLKTWWTLWDAVKYFMLISDMKGPWV